MELNHYLSILWRRKWVLVVTVVSAFVAIAIGHSRMAPVYTATTTLRVATSVIGVQTSAVYTNAELLRNTYVEIATSRPVMDELLARLDSNEVPDIRAEVIPTTELIRITAQSPDPKLAAQASNTLAEILIEQSDQLYMGGSIDSGDVLAVQVEEAKVALDKMRKEYEALIVQTPAAPDQITVTGQLLQEKQRTYESLLRQHEQARYREAIESSMITLVESAIPPTVPTEPRVAFNYTLGALLGLIGGIILAFIFENLDTRLHDTSAIESASNTSLLARLPKTGKGHLILSHNGSTPLAETVRHLAAQIQWMDRESPRRVLLLAGSEPGQGASTAAVNLSMALAEQGQNVVVVDYNLRHPHLHEMLNLPNEHGLSDVLAEGMDLKKAIQKSPAGSLSVLTSGPGLAAPSLAFDSARAEKLINTLRQQFDYILLDAPALTVADVASLAPYTDGLILVVRRSHAQRDAVESAGNFMARFEGKYLGLIVNEAEGRFAQTYI
ncbi:MAG: hypothetical protein C4583_10520 [Anaerolineaceae bacterium]|nr:MAG: hypothetical protein C4583_10520 [Anaerolineaceae bacterium]